VPLERLNFTSFEETEEFCFCESSILLDIIPTSAFPVNLRSTLFNAVAHKPTTDGLAVQGGASRGLWGRDDLRSQPVTERWVPPSAIKRDALPESNDEVKFRKVRSITSLSLAYTANLRQVEQWTVNWCWAWYSKSFERSYTLDIWESTSRTQVRVYVMHNYVKNYPRKYQTLILQTPIIPLRSAVSFWISVKMSTQTQNPSFCPLWPENWAPYAWGGEVIGQA